MSKLSDEQFVADFEDFATTANNNKSELNISSEDSAEMADLAAKLTNQLNEMQSTRAAADAAEAAFSQTRKAASSFKTSRKRYFSANPNASVGLKASLGITQANASSYAATPIQPIDLSAQGFESGVNLLKWERNGNSFNTNFIIEYRYESGSWLIAGSTRKTKYEHKNQTPGVKVYYRVYAERNDFQSSHSNTGIVYA